MSFQISIKSLLPDDPLSERINYWETSTSTLYDPYDSAKTLTHKTIVCPACVKHVVVRKLLHIVQFSGWNNSKHILAFLNEGGSGYAQTKFKSECPCGHLITKETLGIHKFAKNLLEFSESDTTKEKYFAYISFPSLTWAGLANIYMIQRQPLPSRECLRRSSRDRDSQKHF